jgi:hypothetical protein
MVAVTALVATPASPATAAAGPAAPAAPAGSIGVRLLGLPGAPSANPLARVYIIDHVHPGTTIHRQIEAVNTTTAALPVTIYPDAATITKGAFVGSAGHAANDLTSWTSVSPSRAEIPAHGFVIATVTIAVPSEASQGEQYGVVWLENRSPASGGVTEVNRVGIRIYLSVGSGGAPPSNFTIGSITATRAADGQPEVVASVHNTGGLALGLSGSLQLTHGPGGLNDGPFPLALGTNLAPGFTEPVTVLLNEELPDGPWDATISVVSGLLQRSARATITFPSPGSRGGAGATTATGRAHHHGRDLLIFLLLLLLLAVAFWLYLRRRARAKAA